MLEHTGLSWDLFRRLLHNFHRDGGRLTLDRVDRLLDNVVVPADNPVPRKLAGDADGERNVVFMERRRVLEPHLERRARELLAEDVEQVLPGIRPLFFHVLLPLLSR